MKIYETLPSGIKIVEFQPSLAASIAEMWNLSNEDWGGSSALQTESSILARYETSSDFNVYIAVDGETAVGYCSFARYFYDANTAYIPLLGVRPDYKSKKIGKALVLRCVQRAIELGFPRLDLFTWSGNTAAVPLYKKCGFLWEDRPSSTHLANFIPTIVTTPLFEEFFKKADWYADSTRSLEIKPDGVKTNNFEIFGYTWEKDGEKLEVGFERSGSRMRLIETNDYKIELMAQDHELAFGLDYNCAFTIENKTGRELNIKINGKDDGNIKFDYSLDTKITGKQEFPASFHVGAVNEPQDSWKIYPCLLADVEINGQAVTFGVGIDSKFPAMLELTRECVVDQIGMATKTHINVCSSLLEDAQIVIEIPENKLLSFTNKSFTVSTPAQGKTSISTEATTIGVGFEMLQLNCTATLKSGKVFNFTAPLEVVTRDMTHSFGGENLYSYSIYNGPWGLHLNKDENEATISHLTNEGYTTSGYATPFDPPKLGKPYVDEFNLLKPNIKTYAQGNLMIMEAEYVSEKFAGMAVTQVYKMASSGLITRHSIIENRAAKPQHIILQDSYGLELGDSTVFSYNGQIMQNNTWPKTNGVTFELSGIDQDNFDENWVFEASPTNPKGFCWPAEYKCSFRWGTVADLEIDPGELAPGQIFETQPVTYAYSLFTNFNDFRNFACQTNNIKDITPSNPIDVVINNYNPFITTTNVKLEVINNREKVQEGDISVSSNIFVTQTQTNPHENIVRRNDFDLTPTPASAVELATVSLNTASYDKTYNKAMFFPKGEVTCTQDGTNYTVSNGAITFKVDPKYGPVCYSLSDAKGQEWLLSQYPEHKPFAWWNPYLGGLTARPTSMNTITVLKEKIEADFTKVCDNFGNTWHGICTTMTISDDDKLKGAVYKIYFLTQPGLPIVCTFFSIKNGTGEYKNSKVNIIASLNPDADQKNVYVDIKDKNMRDYRLHMGTEDLDDITFENMAIVSSSREEKLYAFHCNKHSKKQNLMWGNNKFSVEFLFPTQTPVANGETFTSSPAFFVVSDKDLPHDALDDLGRISLTNM